MRNFKDIIIEKLKVSADNNIELPNIEDFKDAIYNFNTGHEIIYEDIDPKYKDIKNCPKYKLPGSVNYVVSLYVSKRMNSDKTLFANSTDEFSFVPLLIIIANNSAFDNIFSPYNSNFSYGLSLSGSCLIFIVIYVLSTQKIIILVYYIFL
mgnify:CR=1 FL=1